MTASRSDNAVLTKVSLRFMAPENEASISVDRGWKSTYRSYKVFISKCVYRRWIIKKNMRAGDKERAYAVIYLHH